VPEFSLTTTWSIPASIQAVWACLVDTKSWPSWWEYVATVEETDAGDAFGVNNARRYCWRTCLPYRLVLNLRVTEIQPCHHVIVEVTGDLQGEGRCYIYNTPETGCTQVEFHWQVRTLKPWMRWFTSLTAPIFAWNHNRVMKHGEKGLIGHLSTIKT
jgi:uncharacterized protein YndB with AHSA1/START domain